MARAAYIMVHGANQRPGLIFNPEAQSMAAGKQLASTGQFPGYWRSSAEPASDFAGSISAHSAVPAVFRWVEAAVSEASRAGGLTDPVKLTR